MSTAKEDRFMLPLRLRKWMGRARFLRSEYHKVQGEATLETLRRFRAMLFLAIPVHLALALWFSLYQVPPQRPDLAWWALRATQLHLSQSALLLLFGLAVHRYLRRHSRASLAGVVLQIVQCALYLSFGAAAAILDVMVGHGIATFLIICQGIAALSLMRPMMAAGLFGVAYPVFLLALLATVQNNALLSTLHIQAVCSMLISLLLSLVMWHQYTRMVLLRRQLSRSNQALLQKQQELAILAQRDALTGLYNRRQFTRLADMELARAGRVPGGLALLMVDLDFFKRINDQHGHPAGDEVLRQVALRLSEGVRTTDLIGRVGGEEFMVLLPHTGLDHAVAVAEKLRCALHEQPVQLPDLSLTVTASIGLTWLAENQKSALHVLYAAADQALYNAKRHGRNRVEVALPAGPTPPTV